MFYIADTGLKQGKYESSWIFVLAPWTTKCHKEFLWTQTLLLTISLHVFAQACSDMHLPQRQKIASQFCTIFWITYSDTYTMSLKQKKRKKSRQRKTKVQSCFITRNFEMNFFPPQAYLRLWEEKKIIKKHYFSVSLKLEGKEKNTKPIAFLKSQYN